MVNDMLNIALFIPQTLSLGPGLRAALWVQGCPFHCPGCIVPEWQLQIDNQLTPIDLVRDWILQTPSISGITISGGEPFSQSVSLAKLVSRVKKVRDLDVISFSGYTLGQLMNRFDQDRGIEAYLDQLDVLIDGPYIQKLDDNKGLRGSSNQKIHYLTNRLAYFDFENTSRKAEFHILDNSIVMTGVPPLGINNLFNDLAGRIQKMVLPFTEVDYER